MMRYGFSTLRLEFGGRFLPAIDDAQKIALALELDRSGTAGRWTHEDHTVHGSVGFRQFKPVEVTRLWTFEAESEEDARIGQRHLDSLE